MLAGAVTFPMNNLGRTHDKAGQAAGLLRFALNLTGSSDQLSGLDQRVTV